MYIKATSYKKGKFMEITTVDRPTKIQRVFDFMRSGSPLTAGEARKRFRVTNMRATMHDLREAFDRFDMNYTVVRETRNGRSYYRVARNRSR
jgi:Helix-turn-helix domain